MYGGASEKERGEREKKIHIFRGGEIEVALCALTELRLRTERGPGKILKVLSMYHHPLLASSILSVLNPKQSSNSP